MNSLLIFIAAIATALFGLSIAILPTKDSHGLITTDAKLMFAGIVLCAILSLVANKSSERNTKIEAAERHDALLSTMTREARRIDPSQIRAIVSYDAPFQTGADIAGPNFLNGKWTATLHVQHARPEFPLNRWDPFPLLGGTQLVPAVNQTYPRMQYHNGGGFVDTAVEIFTDFVGDLDGYAEPITWNNAFVELHLVSKNQAERLKPWIANWPFFNEGPPDLDSYKNPSPPSAQIYDPASCEEEGHRNCYEIRHFQAVARIFVASRQVAMTEGRIVSCEDGINDLEDAILKFPIVQVAADAFPSLGETADIIPSTPTRLLILGWAIVALIVCIGTALIWRAC